MGDGGGGEWVVWGGLWHLGELWCRVKECRDLAAARGILLNVEADKSFIGR